jgi:choline-sulfatase
MPPITRKQFLAAPAALGATQAASQAPGRRPKNVLFLLSDQHRPTALGVRGDPHARTPHLDSLAREGLRFDNAYCAYPVCTPSRAALLTGTWAHTNRVYNNATPWPWEIKTMAHHFGHHGYATALIGKMHFVDAQTHGFDYRLDFNDWFQYLGPKAKTYADELSRPNSGSGNPQIDALWSDYGDPWKGARTLDNREGFVHVGRASLLEERDHFESFVARETIRFIKNFGTKNPFFAISSYLKPHDPFMPPERFARMFRAEDMRLPATFHRLRPGAPDEKKVPKVISAIAAHHGPTPEVRDESAARTRMAMYYANIAYLDEVLGGVLKALDELGLRDDTLVVYSSDHGEMLGEHGCWQKSLFYEPSCGVPLIFRGPGLAPAGSVCQTPVTQVGLAATLLDACGLPLPHGLDEPSFLPLLRDPKATWTRPVFAEYALGTRQARAMLRRGSWKYNHWANDIPELYDLASDPAEKVNLASDPGHQSRVAEMRRELLAFNSLA